MENLNNKIKSATKWSAIAEVLAKLVTPIVSIVLAHLLTPEAFGVVATLTMIISFAEIFTDAGFQKYIVQHEFIDDRDFNESVNVAFWSNLIMSFAIWFIIVCFCEPLATLVGNPGLGNVLAIACVSIPLVAFSGIQVALYRRELDFKTLFKVRMISIVVPLVVTIPMAFWLRSYWALILGTIAQNLVNVIVLSFYSKWKPRFFYSFAKLKEMLSFTVWSMIEAVSIWLTSYVDVFIVGTMLNQHYLGLYKTSSAVVGQLMGLITGITTPILFASLSRLQDNPKEFQRLFFNFQKYVALLVMPIGVGFFCYSDLLTKIFLGEQWLETSGFIGLWGLTSAVTIVFSHYCSEVYRAKGRPKLSVFAQFLHIVVLWPVVFVAVKYGYQTLYIARSLVRVEGIIVDMIIIYYFIKISPWKMFVNVFPAMVAAVVMGVLGVVMLHISSGTIAQLLSIGVCAIVYVFIVRLFAAERQIIDANMKPMLFKLLHI